MLRRMVFIAIGLVLICTSAYSQTTQSDTVWVKEIGSEVKAVKFSPDGQFIYAAAIGRKPMKLSAETGEILREYEQISDANSMDLTKDGTEMVVGGGQRQIQRFNLETGKILIEFKIPDSLNTSQYFDLLSISSLSISKDERFLAAALIGGNSIFENVRRVLIWDYQSGQLIKIIDDNWCENVLFSPTQQLLAISHSKSVENAITLIDIGTWETSASLCCHSNLIQDIAFSPDGTMLATCGWGGEIKVWDISKGNEPIILPDYNDITAIGFLSNNQIVCNGSIDYLKSFTKIWDIKEQRVLAMIPTSRPSGLDIYQKSKDVVLANYKSILLFNADKLVTSIYQEEIFLNNFKITPNPSMSSFKISFNLQQAGNTKVEILDINSNQISILHTGFMESGNQSFTWLTNGVPSGTYFCQITTKNFSKTLKIVLEK